ncbi:MAG: OmpH family outer membrane protein [Chthoniobacteraceae bacterium]
MKSYFAIPLLLVSLAFSAVSASAQVTKIGTVDMKKVFENYYKTKDAEARINEARNAAKKEMDDRMDVYNKGVNEVKKMNEEIESPALGKEAKETKSKVRDEKVAELNAMQREINEFRQTREKQLQEQSVRMRGGIVDEINKIVEAKVKSENFDVVFDKSGPSLNGVPVVLHSRESFEFTDEVVKQLNKNKGKEEPAPAKAADPAKPATPAKPADKK